MECSRCGGIGQISPTICPKCGESYDSDDRLQNIRHGPLDFCSPKPRKARRKLFDVKKPKRVRHEGQWHKEAL
jgi:hypothetical protein